MIEILNFTFASAAHFFGVLLLICAPLVILDNTIKNVCMAIFERSQS